MRLSLCLFTCLLAFAGCDDHDHDDHDHGGETLALGTEACEHTNEGPFLDVDGAADTANAPSLAFPHTATRIAIADADATHYVRFDASEAGEYIIFVSADVPVEILDNDGNVIEIEATSGVDECAEVVAQHTVDLTVGSVLVGFGPTSETTLSVVVEEAGGEHDHAGEHDHE